jgi:2-polyprenyl-3-methyl-5-hydroxy-6-metoxy-1,4-benzoquinol methylase
LPNEWIKNFDTVVCLEVIEHLFNPIQLVRAVDFTLKEGGIAIISTHVTVI